MERTWLRCLAPWGLRLPYLEGEKRFCNKLSKELETKGIRVSFHKCDVRSPEQIAKAVEFLEKELGPINVLVNNAAGNFVSPTEKLSPHAVDSVLNIVLHGTLYMTLELGKKWISRGQGGVVLNIVTPYAWTGSAYVVPSAAAKAGVLAVVRSLAVEWAKYGIRHVAIAPGIFPTEATQKNLFPLPGMEEALKRRVPLGRTGEISELTTLAAYLISDNASFINGEVITIDGGEWLKGAGEFNELAVLTDEQWEQIKKIATGK